MHIKRVAIFSLIIIGTSYGLFRAIRVPAKTITIAAAPTVLPTASASAQPSARPSPSPTPSPLATTSAKINKYPETKLTPGATIPINIDVLCLTSYDNKTANITEATVEKVYQRYGLDYETDSKAYKIDALIPVNLGGSSDITNLWPQPIAVPGYNEKNAAEKSLRKQMCTGAITLTEAQKQIKTDWYAVFNKIR